MRPLPLAVLACLLEGGEGVVLSSLDEHARVRDDDDTGVRIGSTVSLLGDVRMPMSALAAPRREDGANPSQVAESLFTWVKSGGRHIEAAPTDDPEYSVGFALEDMISKGTVKRQELFLTAKLPSTSPLGFRALHHMVNGPMKGQLRTDYFDLLLMPSMGGKEEHLRSWLALEQLRSAGEVRALGVYNFQKDELEDLMHGVLAETGKRANMTISQISILDCNDAGYFCNAPNNETGTLEQFRNKNVHLQVYVPLESSGQDAKKVPYAGLASSHNVTAAQVAIRWNLQSGNSVVAPLRDLAPVFTFSLSADEMTSLGATRIGF